MKFKLLMLCVFAGLLPVIGYTAQTGRNTIYDPTPSSTIYPIQDDSAPALMALAAMYAPTDEEAGWLRLVCTGMTEGGCAYFKENQAKATRESQNSTIGSSSGFIATEKVIDERTELWKATVTIVTPGNRSTSDVYALVRRGDDGRWKLDRIISGPGVSLP